MLGTSEALLVYYLGFGYVILLGWAIAVPNRRLDEATATRYLRWTTVAAIVGVAHPAIALAARDVAGQVAAEIDDGLDLGGSVTRVTTIANVFGLLSALPVVALMALSVGS